MNLNVSVATRFIGLLTRDVVVALIITLIVAIKLASVNTREPECLNKPLGLEHTAIGYDRVVKLQVCRVDPKQYRVYNSGS